jgi:hypothetical protein
MYSVDYELTVSTCFEHYLLTFRRRCINNSSQPTKYARNIPTRATSSEKCSLQAAQRYTTQAAFLVWPPKSGSYLLIVLLMMGILVPETCLGNKTAYFVASSWFFTFAVMGHYHQHHRLLLLHRNKTQ